MPPSDGVSGVGETPFSPWHARHCGWRSGKNFVWAMALLGRSSNRAKTADRKAWLPVRQDAGSGGSTPPPPWLGLSPPSFSVADAIDRAVPVIGDQQRAVLHHLDIDRPTDIFVVLDQPFQERLHRFVAALLVKIDDHDV